MNSLLYKNPAMLIAAVLFVLMILFNRLGFFIRQKQIKKTSGIMEGLGPVEGSLLGLLALLLSFTFSMSAAKNDTRRGVIVEEANDISTAILRCDLYPDSVRKILRPVFDSYIDARIDYYNAGIDTAKLNSSLQRTNEYSTRIWKRVMYLSQDKENTLRSQQMIPALNAMMDVVTTREAERIAHVPESILLLLFILTLAGSFIIGYGSSAKRFNWIVSFGFALMTAMTIYLILDLDRPRRGLINMDSTQAKIIDLKDMLK
jgi:hypothetical protein